MQGVQKESAGGWLESHSVPQPKSLLPLGAADGNTAAGQWSELVRQPCILGSPAVRRGHFLIHARSGSTGSTPCPLASRVLGGLVQASGHSACRPAATWLAEPSPQIFPGS